MHPRAVQPAIHVRGAPATPRTPGGVAPKDIASMHTPVSVRSPYAPVHSPANPPTSRQQVSRAEREKTADAQNPARTSGPQPARRTGDVAGATRALQRPAPQLRRRDRARRDQPHLPRPAAALRRPRAPALGPHRALRAVGGPPEARPQTHARPTMPRLRQTTVRFDAETWEQVGIHADRLGLHRAAFIREATQARIARSDARDETPATLRTRRPPRSHRHPRPRARQRRP